MKSRGIGKFFFCPLASLFSIQLVVAGPAVNVGLKASWNGAPFLLELLETAAQENPKSYFPLLDRITSGSFSGKTSEKELYEEFLGVAKAEGFLTDPEEISSFDFALSIHAAAPRIETHYQYYENWLKPLMGLEYDPSCEAWLQWNAKQICSTDEDYENMLKYAQNTPNDHRKLPFDRILEGEEGKPMVILYGDIEAPGFRAHREKLKKHAEEGHVSYVVRYKPPAKHEERPVILSGYGVSLVLKKTDYIVMDDRDIVANEENIKQVKNSDKSSIQQVLGGLQDAEINDITPLQGKDLAGLGYKTASVIMSSEKPLDTFLNLLEDFPKYSAAIAAADIDPAVAGELETNWKTFVGRGVNVLWINGLRMESSQINAFGLLEHLRQERQYINGLKSLGLDPVEAVRLISYETLVQAKQEEELQRFNYRDDIEGGKVIVWLNNLEKDKRYSDWTSSNQILFRRTYPGNLHPIRKNIHNLVLPVDFSSQDDLELILRDLRTFVEHKVALRFGLVPLIKSIDSADQTKVIYHLIDTYGLLSALQYMESSLKKEFSKPNQKSFDDVMASSKLRPGKTAMVLGDVLQDSSLEDRVTHAQDWCGRLRANTDIPTLFINGLPIPKTVDWASEMTSRLHIDIITIQRRLIKSPDYEDIDFAAFLLDGASTRRNPHIFPETERDFKLIHIANTMEKNKDVFSELPEVKSDQSHTEFGVEIWVIGDFDEKNGYELLKGAAKLQKDSPGVNLKFIYNPQSSTNSPTLSALLYHLQKGNVLTPETLQKLLAEVQPAEKDYVSLPSVKGFLENAVPIAKEQSWSLPDHAESRNFWKRSQNTLLKDIGLKPGEKAIILNGRIVGPIPNNEAFVSADFKQLLEYETDKRIRPVLEALKDLGIASKIKNGAFGLAAVTNQVALTGISEVPVGVLETPDFTRTDIPDRMLAGEHTAISVGDMDKASIQIIASINPSSEEAQMWASLLKVLSEMSGVHLRIFLNPEKSISELPIKRFYRHVLCSKPSFDDSGRLVDPRAKFENIPENPLLSLSMDVPPSWLVTPKESVHDLDNLKLSALQERLRGREVEALYELKNILIEGHSRDDQGAPPRGAQLVLGTIKEPHFADTIIMANLGYFQFKANPGLWKATLKHGRSKDIYNIDTLGTKGMYGLPKNSESEVALLSFRGATLFPTMSRKSGMEEEDVLAPATPISKGAMGAAKNWLNKIKIRKPSAEVAQTLPQAEINIFSVASGHLYERFLNIMMLSVMKNTNHTVKFWFIENFLSPSFKDLIPTIAEEYGFEYELVTYKWPHWLRAQKEKQREIWGYKILFLDVLFPLDLEKVIFVDADQIVRTDLKELVDHDLHGAPYGFTPMCDSREEIEGFRFWKQGYWKNYLRGLPYHISALYVVDLNKFRAMAAGDKLRQQYHQLSADPHSLANLDQDLPNHMQTMIPIHSLPQDWLWCETWCSDESLKTAKTIDLCNNPMTKEPKLSRARRQVPEWTEYDEEATRLAKKASIVNKNMNYANHLQDDLKVASSMSQAIVQDETDTMSVKDEL